MEWNDLVPLSEHHTKSVSRKEPKELAIGNAKK